jgi:hypothetical protein
MRKLNENIAQAKGMKKKKNGKIIEEGEAFIFDERKTYFNKYFCIMALHF